MKLTIAWCALAAAMFAPPIGRAAEYPEKPIRWIVPWPPGGGYGKAASIRFLVPPDEMLDEPS